MGALISAILSTVDSTLLAASALATHNLIYPMMTNLTDRKRVVLARRAVLISGLIGYAIAFSSELITDLVHTASELGGIALFTKKGNGLNSCIAMVASTAAFRG